LALGELDEDALLPPDEAAELDELLLCA